MDYDYIEELLEKEELTEEEYTELENKLDELEAELEYENQKMDVCAYGKEELYEVMGLEELIAEIESKLYGE